MVIKHLDCRMYVGEQRRTGTFKVQADPDNIQACQELAGRLAGQHGLPVDRAVMHLKVGARWVQYRPA